METDGCQIQKNNSLSYGVKLFVVLDIQRISISVDVRRMCCVVTTLIIKGIYIFFGPMPPHVLVDFVVLPPGHGSSVTDF